MRSRSRDEGSILVLSLGFIVICILALAVVVDASTVFLARRALQAQADSAALAGARIWATETAASPDATRPTYSSIVLPPGTGMRTGASMISAMGLLRRWLALRVSACRTIAEDRACLDVEVVGARWSEPAGEGRPHAIGHGDENHVVAQ